MNRIKQLKRRRLKQRIMAWTFLIAMMGCFWAADAYFGQRQLVTEKESMIQRTTSSLDSFESVQVVNHDNWKFIRKSFQVHEFNGLRYVPLASESTKWHGNHWLRIKRYRLYNPTNHVLPAAELFSGATGYSRYHQQEMKARAQKEASKDTYFEEFMRETHGLSSNWSNLESLKPGHSVDVVVLTNEAN